MCNTMKYVSFILRALIALALLAMPLACVTLSALTEDYGFLLPLALSFAAILSATELDKKGDSSLIHWFSRPL